MELAVIAFGGQVYRLSAGAPNGNVSSHAGIFRGFAGSFRRLRPSEAAVIDDLRLRIATVREGEDLAQLSKRTGNDWDQNRTAVVNGLTQGEPLVVGTLLKIAVREPYVPVPALDPKEMPDSTAPFGPVPGAIQLTSPRAAPGAGRP